MAHDTELYLLYCEDMLETMGVSPCVVTTREDFIRRGIEEGAIQEVVTKAQQTMRVLRVTEAEYMYKITPEAEEEDEVDEEWMGERFSLPFFGGDSSPETGPAF